jgi:hypothetical protein
MEINTAAWQQFADNGTPSFDEPVFIEGLLSAPERVGRLVDRAVSAATNEPQDGLRLRAFRQGIFDYRLTAALLLTPSGDDTATEWLARVANDPAACVTISDLTAWDLELAAWAQPLIKTLLANDRYALLAGMDTYTFISHSEWTPFGIHKDGEPTLIFHLGPSDKDVWVWPAGAIDTTRLPRNRSWYGEISFEFDRYVPSASHYLLRPGDFISIPTDTFHLFRNLGLSRFLGLSLYPAKLPEVKEIVTRAFWDLAQQDFDVKEPVRSTAAMATALESSLGAYDSTSSLTNAMSCELQRVELQRRTYGYAACPALAALPQAPPPSDTMFRWAFAGVIAAMDLPAGSELMIRGRSITFTEVLNFDQLISVSHIAEPVARDDILDALPSALSSAEGVGLFESLYRFGALVVM